MKVLKLLNKKCNPIKINIIGQKGKGIDHQAKSFPNQIMPQIITNNPIKGPIRFCLNLFCLNFFSISFSNSLLQLFIFSPNSSPQESQYSGSNLSFFFIKNCCLKKFLTTIVLIIFSKIFFSKMGFCKNFIIIINFINNYCQFFFIIEYYLINPFKKRQH